MLRRWERQTPLTAKHTVKRVLPPSASSEVRAKLRAKLREDLADSWCGGGPLVNHGGHGVLRTLAHTCHGQRHGCRVQPTAWSRGAGNGALASHHHGRAMD